MLNRYITVVLSDAGPLISLARAGRLDLLERFNAQILITHTVKLEVLEGRLRSDDQERLREWIKSDRNRLRVVKTSWGAIMLKNFRLKEALAKKVKKRFLLIHCFKLRANIPFAIEQMRSVRHFT
ncbi:MAG: hypothetical protein OXC62_11690 [Aestuariivita sp.]|nr:hypothetical protein [Aestuariivita sp.]